MAKKSKQTGEKAGAQPTSPPVSIQTPKLKSSQAGDELRRAVKDLGGDDEDLELINGVDEDDEESHDDIQRKGNPSDEVRRIIVCARRVRLDFGRAEIVADGFGGLYERARSRCGSSNLSIKQGEGQGG